MEAEITRVGVLDIQVCVPSEWTDEQVKEYVNNKYLCGTTNGWQIRKQGHKLLAGADERVKCSAKEGFVHIMLDA